MLPSERMLILLKELNHGHNEHTRDLLEFELPICATSTRFENIVSIRNRLSKLNSVKDYRLVGVYKDLNVEFVVLQRF